MTDAVGLAFEHQPEFCVRFSSRIAIDDRSSRNALIPQAKKKRRGLHRGVFVSSKRIELLRYGLLEHAIDLLVRRVAASLAGLSGLQRLISGALGAISG